MNPHQVKASSWSFEIAFLLSPVARGEGLNATKIIIASSP